MSKRNIAREIIEGMEAIKAWRRGTLKLKTHTVEIARKTRGKRSSARARRKAA